MSSRFNLSYRHLAGNLIIYLLLTVLLQTAGAQMLNPRFRLAQSLLKNHEYTEALTIFKELNRQDPNNVVYIRGLRECLQETQKYDELIVLLTNVSSQFPEDYSWQIDLAEAYYLNDEHIKANDIWFGVINDQPKNIAVYRKIAGSMINQRLFDQAINVYTLAQQNISGQENLHIDIANLYKLQLSYGKATKHLLEFYLHNPNQISYIQNQILAMTDQAEKVTEILEAVEEQERRFPKQKNLAEIKAGIYIKLQKYDLALKSYRELEDTTSGGAFLYRFALSARNNGAYKEALDAYRIILGMHLTNLSLSQIYYDIAHCYRKIADTENSEYLSHAVTIYDSLVNANAPALIRQASLENLGDIFYKNYFDLDRAQEYYYEYLNTTPRNKDRDRVVVKLGDVYRAKNNLELARRTYKQATHKEFVDISQFKQAELIYFTGNFNQAEADFERLLKNIGPNHPLTNDILAYLTDIRTFKHDSLALASFAQAQLLQMRGKKSESAGIFSQLVYDKTILKYRALTSVVGNLFDLGRFDETSRLLSFYQENWPDDLNIDVVYYLRATAAEKMNENQTALELYQLILTKYPNSLYIEEARANARRLDQLIKKEQS